MAQIVGEETRFRAGRSDPEPAQVEQRLQGQVRPDHRAAPSSPGRSLPSARHRGRRQLAVERQLLADIIFGPQAAQPQPVAYANLWPQSCHVCLLFPSDTTRASVRVFGAF